MFAAIDIGSNTVQMLICRAENGLLCDRRNYIATTRLGGGDADGRLSRDAIERTAATVARFIEDVDEAKARCRIVATSAVRDAVNADELRESIRLAAPTAPELEIISGKREAAMSYLGARCSIAFPEDWPVVDVGGSSTELIYEIDGEVRGVSADVGCVRAAKHGWDRAEIKSRLAQVLRPLKPASGCVGVAGTITTAAGWKLDLPEYRREAIEGVRLSATEMEDMLRQLLALPKERRRELSPLLEQRGEIMAEGLWIWLSALEIVGVDELTVCGGGIPDGAVTEMVRGLV